MIMKEKLHDFMPGTIFAADDGGFSGRNSFLQVMV